MTLPTITATGQSVQAVVRAEKAGAWDEGWDAAVGAGERCDVAGGDFTCGECAICAPENPYREEEGT